MNLKSLKEGLEVLTLIAVLASLIAIVVELRQTQNALEASAYQERGFNAMGDLQAQLQNQELIEFRLRMGNIFENIEGAGNIEELRDFDQQWEQLPEIDREKILITTRLNRIELDNEHYQFEKGFLDPEFYFGQTVPAIKAFAPFWRALLNSSEARASFRQEVDRILSED
jgi:hypothetical protein